MIFPDLGIGELQDQLWLLLFVMVRMGAAMVAAPLFGIRAVPVQVRVIFAAAMSVFMLNWLPVQLPDETLGVEAIIAVVGEVVIGLMLGFTLQLAFAAPLLAGEQIAGGMGMAIATAVDPASGGQSGAVGQMLAIMLTLIFLAIGGHLLWLRLVIESYMLFPPGSEWDVGARAWRVASFASQAFATALIIALPVTLVLLLVQLVTGVISRSAPSLNLFALGLPASVLAGIAALIASTPLLTEQFVTLAENAITQVGEIAQPDDAGPP